MTSTDGVSTIGREPPLFARAARSCWPADIETLLGVELHLYWKDYILQHQIVSRAPVSREWLTK